ncbi:MAG: FAD-binding protein [Alphaproteobacteria bacterium]|nr:FAD-binding protein [Alphaproteobacteria bacterium]
MSNTATNKHPGHPSSHPSVTPSPTPSPTPSQEEGIVIAGAGLVGLTTAIALARSGFAVTLLDRAEVDRVSDGLLTTALAAGTMQLLTALQAWDDGALNPCPIQQIQVAQGAAGGQRHNGLIDWSVRDNPNHQPMGYIVENHRLRRHLLNQLPLLGVQQVDNFAVTAVEVDGAGITLQSADGRRLRGALLLAADGRQSTKPLWWRLWRTANPMTRWPMNTSWRGGPWRCCPCIISIARWFGTCPPLRLMPLRLWPLSPLRPCCNNIFPGWAPCIWPAQCNPIR